MPAPLSVIETDQNLPEQADCVIIGAGIIGVSTAYWLARAGINVVLLEKGVIGGEQSSRNWGWCRQQNRDARELPLARRSLQLWEEMSRDVEMSTGFNRCGLIYLSNDDSELETWNNWGQFARGEGVDTRMLTAVEAAQKGTATGKAWKGGVWSPTDGTADTSRAAPAIATGVRKHGGIVIQQCAARGIERSAGAVSAVITEKGTIRTKQVVLSGGAWASSFLHQIGIHFPQASIRTSMVSVNPGVEGLPAALHTKRASITRRVDGGFTLAVTAMSRIDPTPGMMQNLGHFMPMFAARWRTLSPGTLQGWRLGFDGRGKWALDRQTPMEKLRTLDPKPSPADVRRILKRTRALVPALEAATIQARWAGYIDSTPDGVPVIDDDIGVPGLLLAAGFSGHGFGIGPGAGYLISDMVQGKTKSADIEQYRLSRFSKGQWGKVSGF
jgi:glycine/D-amino acid oxidase-like deaminating enzyme